MKRIICLALTLMMALTLIISVSATTKDEFLAELKNSIPEKYTATIYNPIESIFNQIEVTDEQAAQLIEYLNEAKTVITVDRGPTLSGYLEEERTYVVEMFDKACELLDLEYVAVPDESDGTDEVIISVYQNGVKLGDIDGDAVNATNAPEKNMMIPVVAVVMVALCGAAIVVTKKQLSK